jgi:hypothetical protein
MSRFILATRYALIFMACLFLASCANKVTKANYEKVAIGMTLAEVEKLLGKGSLQTGDGSNVAGQFGIAVMPPQVSGGGDVYLWETSKAAIRVTFKDGKVVHRQAEGL